MYFLKIQIFISFPFDTESLYIYVERQTHRQTHRQTDRAAWVGGGRVKPKCSLNIVKLGFI